MKPCCKTYLDEQFGGDPEIIGEIYAEYVNSLQAKLAEGEAMLAAGNWDKLDKAAHTIKGNALAVGDSETAETAIALRNSAKLQCAEDAEALLSRIRALSARL